MNLLLDTHVLLWAAVEPEKLPSEAGGFILDESNQLWFSAASVWEVAIKASLGRADFDIDPHLLRRGLIENGYSELPVTSAHAAAVHHLPELHKDPFDRILVAQAEYEGMLLLTADARVSQYPGPIRRI